MLLLRSDFFLTFHLLFDRLKFFSVYLLKINDPGIELYSLLRYQSFKLGDLLQLRVLVLHQAREFFVIHFFVQLRLRVFLKHVAYVWLEQLALILFWVLFEVLDLLIGSLLDKDFQFYFDGFLHFFAVNVKIAVHQ